MHHSPKLAFWSHFVQAQERYWLPSDFANYMQDSGPTPGDISPEEIPDYARKKLGEVGFQLREGNVARALELEFQSLEICAFALGPNHPSVGALMDHIAFTCESQGMDAEARHMRRTSLELFAGSLFDCAGAATYYQ